MAAARTIQVDGVLNLRDIGGVPFGSGDARAGVASRAAGRDGDGRGGSALDVGGSGETDAPRSAAAAAAGIVRRGVFFRSAALHQLTADGGAVLEQLGVRTVLDLRDDLEAEADPDRLAGTSLRYVRIPIFGSSSGLRAAPDAVGLYEDFVDACGGAFAACLRLLAQDGVAPALVHCAVGKDRTGFLSALLLALAGADEDAIVADFAASNAGLGLVDPHAAGTGQDHDQAPVADNNVHHYVDPGLIAFTLDRVRSRYGSVDDYLLGHGLAPSDLDRLRSLLR